MQFYVLNDRIPEDDTIWNYTEFLNTEDSNVGEALRCPTCGRFVSMLEWLPPYKIELIAWGKDGFGDIVYGTGNEILISERFKGAYQKSSLMGLSEFGQVEIIKLRCNKKIIDQVPDYSVVKIARSQAIIDPKASGVIWEEPPTCSECLSGIKNGFARVIIQEGSWSGEDIFYPRGLPGTILTTQKFKDFCEFHQFKNCRFVRAEEFSRDPLGLLPS